LQAQFLEIVVRIDPWFPTISRVLAFGFQR